MDTYLITGGNKLYGEILLQGSKNSSLPIIAASLLIDGISVISRCPMISDTIAMKDLLLSLGCNVSRDKDILKIDARNCSKDEIPGELMKEIRSSIVLMGPMLARYGRIKLTHPGGYDI